MARLRVKNVYEANKFCFILSRFFNFVSITIDKSFNACTSKFDKLKFIIWMTFGFFCFYKLLLTPLQPDMRSIIFEITMHLNGKFHGLHPLFSMAQFFYFRYEYHKIFKILAYIDKKVSK